MSFSPRHAEQVERIATRYREAFEHVTARLQQRTDGALPEFVFSLDQMDVAQIATIDAEIARAERLRRQWRAALHAMCELAALDTGDPEQPSVVDTLDPEHFDLDAPAPTSPASPPGLDRLISVLQYARSTGCMYVDGGFEPVVKGGRR